MSAIAETLCILHPAGPWTLCAFQPRAVCSTFTNLENALARIEARDGTSDCYIVIARLRDGAGRRKPKKADVESVQWLWTDFDPLDGEDPVLFRERVLRTLAEYKRPPTVVWSTGRGCWAFWRLCEPVVEPGTDFECYLRQLAADFSGDPAVAEVSRVCRLFGTVNTRTGERGMLVEHHPERTYTLEEFPKAPPRAVRKGHAVPAEGQAPVLTDEQVVAANEACGYFDRASYATRSEWQHAVTCFLVRCRIDAELIVAILLDERVAVSEAVLKLKDGSYRPSAFRYAAKQVESALEEVTHDA